MRRGHLTARARRGGPVGTGLDGEELRILALWSRGASTADVAGRLGLPEDAVHAATVHILRKLGVHSRVEAVAYALAAGLVDV